MYINAWGKRSGIQLHYTTEQVAATDIGKDAKEYPK